MNQGIIFAIIAAVVFGLWTVFHDQATKYVDPLLGAVIVSLTAVIFGVILLLPKFKVLNFNIESKGLIFIILAGICALALDFFALKAYGSGLPVSVGGPIIIGGSIIIASLIGFFLGESFTPLKVLGILFVVTGVYILSLHTK